MEHAFTIQPRAYTAFDNETEQLDKCKEWGLLSDKAVKMKALFYKRNGMSLSCSVVGFADKATAVIRFDNDQLHCIHPSYLKEMQASNYGAKASAADTAEEAGADAAADAVEEPAVEAAAADTVPAADEVASPDVALAAPSVEAPPKKSKGKKEKLELPEGKVSMTATVQEFTTVPNNFSDTDDEVVIYEAVSILDPAMELGVAWSSHSATLKKLELAIGDTILFEAKLAAKKLTKHPVPYKINNPSKIQKA
ncbi:hypothetical protein RB620_13985 [Paenibacillus sp. LHD-117]|uniref:hypothetical protein n=1 Tax=Paenibacillus sp. LHD-117 TaxID=3071412 RepID=UPI0027E09CC2|nr:hypothetical protein [Paenibacillus sp. LHD-117]MDQ6420535.1 hypothetical protein [Paenibacillus sp. LHD-117]